MIGEAANALTDEFRSSVEGVPWSEVTRLRIRVVGFRRFTYDELTAQRQGQPRPHLAT